MSITVKTGKTENEFFDVTKTVTDETERTVSIVYPCDILNPVFSFKGGYIDANYLTGVFGRKYWITNQTIDKGINYVSCTVDAFASWSDNIYNTKQFVTRSEKHGNEYINDPLFPCTSKPISQIYKGDLITENATYVIGVI